MFNNLISAASTNWIFIALLGVMVVVLVVLPMFTNKKRNKAINQLHSSLRPGDVIKTVGGLIGTITAIRDVSPVDKEMVIETGEGENKCSMVFDVQAVYQVISKSNDPAADVFEEIKTDATAEIAAPETVEAESVIEPVVEDTAKTDAVKEEAAAKDVTVKKTTVKKTGSNNNNAKK